MARPTYDEAALMLRLVWTHLTSGIPAVVNWLHSDQFVPDYAAFVRRYPPGSDGDRNAATICAYFDLLGTLHKQGLLNEELLFDWVAVAPLWETIKGYVLGRRRATGNPALWANFEALATAHKRATRHYST